MNKTGKFHDEKSKLESALIDFLVAAQDDGRDLEEELNEALFNSCKDAGCKKFVVIEGD